MRIEKIIRVKDDKKYKTILYKSIKIKIIKVDLYLYDKNGKLYSENFKGKNINVRC